MSKENNGWISVKDKLPKQGESVLIYAPSCSENRGIDMAWLDDASNGDFCFVGSVYGFDIVDVTHWQPLPEPPKE